MQGYLSRDGMPPGDLLRTGRQEVVSYGGDLIDDTVTEVHQSAAGTFELTTSGADRISARRLLMATGLRDDIPDLPGLAERWARDVLHCPYCHGHEVRDQSLGVIGGTAAAVQHAHLIRQWSSDVVYFARDSTPPEVELEQLAARSIEVVEGEIARLEVSHDRLVGVELVDGRFVPRTALFVRPTFHANDGPLRALGAEFDTHGWPVVDSTGRTSVRGVWAAGNATNPRAQVITAAGEGSATAIAINADLVEEDVHIALTTFRTGEPPAQPLTQRRRRTIQ